MSVKAMQSCRPCDVPGCATRHHIMLSLHAGSRNQSPASPHVQVSRTGIDSMILLFWEHAAALAAQALSTGRSPPLNSSHMDFIYNIGYKVGPLSHLYCCWLVHAHQCCNDCMCDHNKSFSVPRNWNPTRHQGRPHSAHLPCRCLDAGPVGWQPGSLGFVISQHLGDLWQ
jgi:hypothetical protein